MQGTVGGCYVVTRARIALCTADTPTSGTLKTGLVAEVADEGEETELVAAGATVGEAMAHLVVELKPGEQLPKGQRCRVVVVMLH